MQAGFLGRSLDEAAAFGVAAEVEGVEVEQTAGFGEAQGDLDGLGGVVLFQAGEAVEAVA